MEKLVGLKEFRQNVETYSKKVSQGQSFVVLKRSKPIFKVSPIIEEVDDGDDGNWETIIDFTKIKKGGVPIDEVIEALEKIHGSIRKTAQKIRQKR